MSVALTDPTRAAILKLLAVIVTLTHSEAVRGPLRYSASEILRDAIEGVFFFRTVFFFYLAQTPMNALEDPRGALRAFSLRTAVLVLQYFLHPFFFFFF